MGDIENVHCGRRMTPTETSLSIIIVTFNNADTIQSCLSSIPDSTAEIIVVDNASQDDTCAKIMRGFPAVKLVQSSSNTGFAAAVNHGASMALGDRLLLINPDSVLDPNCIPRLLACADLAPCHGIYGGNATYSNCQPNRISGLNRPTLRSVMSATLGLRAMFPGSSLFDPESVWRKLEKTDADAVAVDIVSGACLLVMRPLWNSLGGFDTRYFMYGEDADLCLRARQLGYDPVVVRKATLVHDIGGSATSETATQMFLLTAKMTLARDHGPFALRISAGFLYRLHVLLRLGGSSLLGAATDFQNAARTDWPTLWHNRAAWLCGYPARSVNPTPGGGRR